MKIIKNWKLFESNEESIQEFCKKWSSKLGRYEIVKGEINVDNHVNLQNLGLEWIPKFRTVRGRFDIRNNKLKTLENIPEECDGYLLNNNPLHEKFNKIYNLTYNFTSGYDVLVNDLQKDFIKNCLEYEAWINGKTNPMAIEEAWKQSKLDKSKEILENIDEKYVFIDFNDYEIISELVGNYSNGEELIKILIEKIKKDNSILFYKILVTLVNNSDDPDYYLDFVKDKYDLKLNDNLDDRNINSIINLKVKKLNRSEDTIDRDENNDCFVFIARDKFVETSDGNYKKSLEIENLFKIDIYNIHDLKSVDMMRMRANIQGEGSKVYMIWLPKDFIEGGTEIPDHMVDLINKHKSII